MRTDTPYTSVPVADSDVPPICRRCTHRPAVRWLMGLPFCDVSRTTCALRHGKRRCAEYERRQPVQLTLAFGD